MGLIGLCFTSKEFAGSLLPLFSFQCHWGFAVLWHCVVAGKGLDGVACRCVTIFICYCKGSHHLDQQSLLGVNQSGANAAAQISVS